MKDRKVMKETGMDSEDSHDISHWNRSLQTSDAYQASDELGMQQVSDSSDIECSSGKGMKIGHFNIIGEAFKDERFKSTSLELDRLTEPTLKPAFSVRNRSPQNPSIFFHPSLNFDNVTVFDFRQNHNRSKNITFPSSTLDEVKKEVKEKLKVDNEECIQIREKESIEMPHGVTLLVNPLVIIKKGKYPDYYVIIAKRMNYFRTVNFCIPIDSHSTPTSILSETGITDNMDYVLFYDQKILDHDVTLECSQVPAGVVLVAVKRKQVTKSFVYNVDPSFSHVYHICGENIDTVHSYKSKLKQLLTSRMGLSCREENIFLYNKSYVFSDSDQPGLISSEDEFDDEESHQHNFFFDVATPFAVEAKFSFKTKHMQARSSGWVLSGMVVLEPEMSFHELRQKIATHSRTDPLSLKLFINGEKVPVKGNLKHILNRGKPVSIVAEICEECTVQIITHEVSSNSEAEEAKEINDFTLQIYKLENIKALKHKIVQKLQIPVHKIDLAFNKVPLKTSTQTLKEYGIRDFSKIYCVVYTQRICLNVKVIKWRKEVVLIRNPDVATVLDVIYTISGASNCLCSTFRAVFNHTHVGGKETLMSLNVKDGDTLTLLPQPDSECQQQATLFQADTSGRIDVLSLRDFVPVSTGSRRHNQCVITTDDYCDECDSLTAFKYLNSPICVSTPLPDRVSLLYMKVDQTQLTDSSQRQLPLDRNYESSVISSGPEGVYRSCNSRGDYRHKSTSSNNVNYHSGVKDGVSQHGTLIKRETKRQEIFEDEEKYFVHSAVESTVAKAAISGNMPLFEKLCDLQTPLQNGNITFDNGTCNKLRPDVVSDRLIMDMSSDLVMHWINVGRRLEITENTIALIKEKHQKDLRSQAHEMLLKWRQMKGNDATRKCLAMALQEEKLMLIVHKYKMEEDIGSKTC